MRTLRALLFSLLLLAVCRSAPAQISVGISVSFGPPAIPVYEQPICPAEGYIWVPGYWAYDDADGYYWVPGTWVLAPQAGYLWTPGWWGWNGAVFIFHEGYWGPHVGFYGGINYGFGYTGSGYWGGRWEGNHFAYNTYVNRVNTTIIHNTYNITVNNVTETRISYNGGQGGITARPTPQEESYGRESHIPPIAAQQEHIQQARANPQLRAATNQGRPPIAATVKPADFGTGAVAASRAGGEYRPPPTRQEAQGRPENAPAPGNEARPGNPPANASNQPRPENQTYNHASELQQHTYKAPNTGNDAVDKRYQQQQDNLAARQEQQHQRLQQQQEREHQQAQARNYSDTQKQQMEQRHAQQTQKMEQKHATQEQHLQQHQAAHAPPKKEK